MNSRQWKVSFIIPVLMLACISRALPQVTIIRTLPETGENRAEAEWKSPAIMERDPIIDEETFADRFSGRIILGAYGTGSQDAVTINEWTTDSLMRYQDFVGRTGLMDVQLQALRDTGIGSFEQRYKGTIAYSNPSFSVTMNGDYDQSEIRTAEGDNAETAGKVGLDIKSSEDVQLPFHLTYSSSWDQSDYKKSDEDPEEKQEESHSIQAASELSFDRLVFSLDGALDIHHDRLADVTTTGYGGTLGGTYALSGLVGLYAGVAPAYSETEYQRAEKNIREQSIESDLGLLFTFSEGFEGEIHGRRVDAWRSDPDFITDDLSHTSIWKGATAWSLVAPQNLASTASYEIARNQDGSLRHDFSGSSTWEQEEGVLKKSGVHFSYALVDSEQGTTTSESTSWGANLSLEPAEMMKLQADYNGSRTEQNSATLQHLGAINYSHAPAESFAYAFGTGYTYKEEAGTFSSLYKGTGKVQVLPVIGYRQLSFELSELFELEEFSGGVNILSNTGFSTSLPLTRQVKVRYSFGWEWVDLGASGEDGGSAFLHTAGLNLSGPGVPFALNTSYLVGHGFRGVQHQVDARLEVPLVASFHIISKFSYRYAETVTYETPYIFSLLGRYEF